MKIALRAIALMLLATALPAETMETAYFQAALTSGGEWPATITFHIRRNDNGQIISGVVDYDIYYDQALVWSYGRTIVSELDIHQGDTGVNGPVVIESGLDSRLRIPRNAVLFSIKRSPHQDRLLSKRSSIRLSRPCLLASLWTKCSNSLSRWLAASRTGPKLL